VSDVLKPVVWVGSSREDLKQFPAEVQDVMGFAPVSRPDRREASRSQAHRGFGGAGVLEIVDDFQGDTYRAVYTVKFPNRVYVLHAFQKKARRGIKTSRRDIDLIRQRYRQAEVIQRRLAEENFLGDE
jgi:phage-related protein